MHCGDEAADFLVNLAKSFREGRVSLKESCARVVVITSEVKSGLRVGRQCRMTGKVRGKTLC